MQYSNDDYSSVLKYSRYRFIDSEQKKNGRFNKSYKSKSGVYRLWEELGYPYDPCFYSLRHHHLGIDKEFAASRLINDHFAIKAWKMVIRELFCPPYFFKFEVGKPDSQGKLGLLHVHLVADIDAGLPRRSREGEIVKLIPSFEDFRKVMKYLYKIIVPDCPQARAEYIEALKMIEEENKRLPISKQRKQPPQVSGFVWD